MSSIKGKLSMKILVSFLFKSPNGLSISFWPREQSDLTSSLCSLLSHKLENDVYLLGPYVVDTLIKSIDFGHQVKAWYEPRLPVKQKTHKKLNKYIIQSFEHIFINFCLKNWPYSLEFGLSWPRILKSSAKFVQVSSLIR